MILSLKDSDFFQKILSLLKIKAVGIMPCDTIYGLVGIAPDTLQKLKTVKGRDEKKPFLMLTHSEQIIETFSEMPLPLPLKPFWPGPLTILFPQRNSTAKAAFRIPNDPLLLTLLEKLNKPLFSTSVNFSGQEFLWKIKDIINNFETHVDFIVDAGDLPYAVPSTIIDITTVPYSLIREGAVLAQNIPVELQK